MISAAAAGFDPGPRRRVPWGLLGGVLLAALAHLALFAVLSLVWRVPPVPVREAKAIDVSLVDDVALDQRAPPTTEAPAQSLAPEQGAPEDAPPPAPADEQQAEPTPPKPQPAAAPPPKPAPKAAPAPPKPVAESRTRQKPKPPSPRPRRARQSPQPRRPAAMPRRAMPSRPDRCSTPSSARA